MGRVSMDSKKVDDYTKWKPLEVMLQFAQYKEDG